MNFRGLKTFSSNETKEVEVVRLWEVRWWERIAKYSTGPELRYTEVSPVVEVFTNEKDAREFVQTLKTAFKVTRQCGAEHITIKQM